MEYEKEGETGIDIVITSYAALLIPFPVVSRLNNMSFMCTIPYLNTDTITLHRTLLFHLAVQLDLGHLPDTF